MSAEHDRHTKAGRLYRYEHLRILNSHSNFHATREKLTIRAEITGDFRVEGNRTHA